jgi:membrane fusion protein (multidrug efflux system)
VPQCEIHIQPQVTGYLIEQDFQEGSFVRKDQILFEIDPRPFEAAVDQARGQLAQERKGSWGKPKRNLDWRSSTCKRDTPLARAHAIAQRQLDNDIQTQKQGEALIASNQAAIQAAEAAVKTAQLNLGFTKVRSLIDGIADSLTASVSWNVDFWGRYRRATEAARAQLLAAEWSRRAVISTLVENLATA